MVVESHSQNIAANPARIAWRTDELSSMLGISRGLLRTHIKSGRLRHKKIGRRILIMNDDLQRFLADAGGQSTVSDHVA